MRISFSTATFYHRGLRYSLGLARDLGFDGVELALGWDYMLRGLPSIERAVRRAHGAVNSVHPPFLPLPGWPRDVALRLRHLAEATRDLGASVLVLHTALLRGEDSPRARWYTRLIEQTQAIAGEGVRICLENNDYHKRSQRYLLDDLETLVRFATARGCGVTFDTCHAGANGEDLLRSYEIVRPVLGNVHLSDILLNEDGLKRHVAPGTGILPLRQFLSVLADDGYDGLITLELHPSQVGLFGRVRHSETLRRALEFVHDAIGSTAPVLTARPGQGNP